MSCADRDAEGGVHGVCREAILPGRQVSGNARPASTVAPSHVSAAMDCCCPTNLPVGSEILLV